MQGGIHRDYCNGMLLSCQPVLEDMDIYDGGESA